MATDERTDRLFKLALGVTVAIGIAALFVHELLVGDTVVRLDFAVYRQSIQSMLAGQGLYDHSIGAYQTKFPVTYPPFAALVMVPTALVPLALGQAIWVLVQLLASLALTWLALTRPVPGRLPSNWHGTALLVVAWLVFMVVALSYWSPVMDPVNTEASLPLQVLQGGVVVAMVAVVVLGLPKLTTGGSTSPDAAAAAAGP